MSGIALMIRDNICIKTTYLCLIQGGQTLAFTNAVFLGRKFKTEHYSAVGCCVIKQYFSLHSVYFLHILLVLTFMAFTLILRNLFAIYFSTMPLVFTQNF